MDLTLDSQEETRCRFKFRGIIKEYRSKTHFTSLELECLLMIHYKLTKEQPMDRKYFRKFMYRALDFQNDLMIDRIFSAFDRENKLALTMESWVLGMSVILKGTLSEKIKFCFKIYDMMNEGFLKKETMFVALKHNYRGSTSYEDPEDIVRDLIEMIVKKMDLDRDGVISFEDYSKSVQMNPSLLEVLGYCLPARPAVYAFMSTFTKRVTTSHAKALVNAPSVHSLKSKQSEIKSKHLQNLLA